MHKVAIFTIGMKILFVCATPKEAVFPGLAGILKEGEVTSLPNTAHTIDVLVTGIGMVATAYHLGRRLLQMQYDLAINFGICGAFDRKLIGHTVNIVQDRFADFGVEDSQLFIDIFQSGLISPDAFPYSNGWLLAKNNIDKKVVYEMPEGKGITVNKSSGTIESIKKIQDKYRPDTESMEGASFFYCCLMNSTPCMQLRSVSNYIEQRNKDAWKIEEALVALRKTSESLLSAL